jgi:hypothetical protein
MTKEQLLNRIIAGTQRLRADLLTVENLVVHLRLGDYDEAARAEVDQELRAVEGSQAVYVVPHEGHAQEQTDDPSQGSQPDK